MSSDYWAAYVGGAKIKTDGLKQQTRTVVITHNWPILPGIYILQDSDVIEQFEGFLSIV